MKLYTTPPSILTLVTWVPQSRLAFGHSAHVTLSGGPLTMILRSDDDHKHRSNDHDNVDGLDE